MKILRRLRLSGALAAALAGVVLVTGVSATGSRTAPAPSAHAKSTQLDAHSTRTVAGQTPLFWFDGSRWDYFGFINNIRQLINVYSNNVPGSSNVIDHTDPWNGTAFEVAIQIRDGETLRLRFRRSDLYLVGWYTRANWYNYIGPSGEAEIPQWYNDNHRAWQLNGGANYGALENQANQLRTAINFDHNTVSAYANTLLDANDSTNMARGVLYFTQFVSEAVRFRGISDWIGWNAFADRTADNWQFSTQLPANLVDQETNWGNLSGRYNWMLENNVPQDSPQNALQGWYDGPGGALVWLVLRTMADYALVMNTVKGFPGRS